MTVLKRWAIAAVAAATVMAAGASQPDKPGSGGEQELRDHLENLDSAKKRQLEEKRLQFKSLSLEKRNQLRKLHQDLQAEENREELERVMKAYFEWVLTLSVSERAHLNSITDPEERLRLVARYRASPGKPPWRRGDFSGGPPTGLSFAPRNTYREFGETLRIWAGPYVANRAEELAALLPPEKQASWKASLQKVRSETTDGDKDLWRALLPWYLAGPIQDLPITDTDVTDFEKLLPPDTRKWYAETPHDMKTEIRRGIRGMISYLFGGGDPTLIGLVSAEELAEFEKSLPPDPQGYLARLPKHVRSGHLRLTYFLSKLPSFMREDRENRFSPGRGGSPRGDQRHDGSPGPRRDPRNDFRDRGDGPPPAPGEARPDLPDMSPLPGDMQPPPDMRQPWPGDLKPPSGRVPTGRPGTQGQPGDAPDNPQSCVPVLREGIV